MNGPSLFDPLLKAIRRRLPSAEKQTPILSSVAVALSFMVGFALYFRLHG